MKIRQVIMAIMVPLVQKIRGKDQNVSQRNFSRFILSGGRCRPWDKSGSWSQAKNLETEKNTKRIEIYQSQTVTFWARGSKILFPTRSAEMIDGSEKRKTAVGF